MKILLLRCIGWCIVKLLRPTTAEVWIDHRTDTLIRCLVAANLVWACLLRWLSPGLIIMTGAVTYCVICWTIKISWRKQDVEP